MAIDSTLFAADVPAGTYAIGDILPLAVIDGPANVRSGRGAAILKQIFTGALYSGGTQPYWRIHVKNSDWIDDVENFSAQVMNSYTVFSEKSGCNQIGHDSNLTQNSGWMVYAECVLGGTSTAANSLFAIIDIDYPSVSSIAVPRNIVGIPTSISYDVASVPLYAAGTMTTSTWGHIRSVDYLKAGNEYALDAVELLGSTSAAGFIAFSNAAGMGGLQRIIPINVEVSGIRHAINYSSKLVKGPMDIKMKFFAGTAGTINVTSIHDYVRRAKA